MSENNFIKVSTPLVGEEEVQAVREVLLSGQYVSGKRVQEFERAFAEYIGVEHAVAVNSGTAALYIALESMGVGPGDQVIVPPLTFFATVSSVLYLGAEPVFADIDPDDLCLSPEDAAAKITPKTKVILPVHLYGAVAKMDKLEQLAADNGVYLLEDCAQAHGAEYDGRRAGSMGHAGSFSFFATKNMTTGEGGIITTNDAKLAELSRTLRNHGMSGRNDHELLGYNNRMTEMEAAMGLVQLSKLEAMNSRRIAISERILNEARKLPWALVPVPEQRVKHTYFWCPLMVKPESGKTVIDLKEHLERNGIGFRHRYLKPLYKQPVLNKLGYDFSDLHLPNVEKAAGQVLGLPNHPGLSDEEVQRVIDVLTQFS